MMTQTNTPASLEDVRKEERLLQARGFNYTTITVPLSDIDLESSRIWNGRVETESRLSEDKVFDYALRMLDGETFPYGIVYREKPSAKLNIVSGVHRAHGAVEAELPSLTWFEITDPITPETVDRIKALGIESNTRHGLGLSQSERLFAACDQIDKGIPITQVSSNLGLDEKEIREALDEREINKQLRLHNLKPDVFTTKVQKREVLRLPDEGLMRDVQVFIRRNTGEGKRSAVTNEIIVELVRALREEKSPQGRATVLENAEKAMKTKKKGKGSASAAHRAQSLSPKFTWGRLVSTVPAISPNDIATLAGTTEGAHQILDEVQRVRKVLNDVESAVETRYGISRFGQ